MSDERKRGLGRGLSALLGEDGAGRAERRSEHPRPADRAAAPRHATSRAAGSTRTSSTRWPNSIAAQGVLQPLLVRRHPSRAGRVRDPRRRAALARGAARAACTRCRWWCASSSDREALEIALVENVQRQDLQPLEEARGYQRLIEEFGHTQEELGARVGKSRSHVANMMRLLALPEAVRQLLEEGRLTAGHARALLGADDPDGLAREVLRGGLSVRQTEQLVQGAQRGPAPPPASNSEPGAARDPNLVALERDMSARLGLKVSIAAASGERGQLVIHYRTLDQFQALLGKLMAPSPKT